MKKKIISYLYTKQKRAVLLRAFHIWQHRPYEVAPLSDVSHKCTSCGTEYTGNYCPRCGQSAQIGRFSFKKAILHFLIVWGVGNRSMFRTIRDLIFRPGFMIRDYLRGMQSAYFPPFNMFFLLATFSLVVEHGISLGLGEKEQQTNPVKTEVVANQEEENDDTKLEKKFSDQERESKMLKISAKFVQVMSSLWDKNPAVFSLLSLVLFSIPLFMFFRTTPAIPDLRFSEFIVALVYTSNSYSIFSAAGNLLDLGILKIIAILMIFVSLKQFSGYSKLRVLWYIILSILISFTILTIIIGLWIYIVYLAYK